MTETPRVVLLMTPFAGYDRGLLQGIARYTQLHGPWVFCLSGDHPGVPIPRTENANGEIIELKSASGFSRRTPFNLQRLGASGVIGRITTRTIARTLMAARLPVIAIDLTEEQLAASSPLSKISEIRAGSHNAGRMAAQHLLDGGLTHFGFCGYEGRIWSERRRRGFCECLLERGFPCNVYQPPRGRRPLSWRREQSSATAWLRSLPKPVGIMACNDVRGREIIERCLQAGLRVPDDVAVVGVDEDRLQCDLANPSLSSVALNLERAGYEAAELLDGLMSGRIRKPRCISVEPMWVIPRRSTDVVAVEDHHVAAAVRFIRDHFRQAITIDDVVAEVGVSRRNLEIRVQHHLGRSMREEIQRVRLAWGKRLLAETNLSAEKIAALSGFKSLSYLSSVFRRELAMTLREYRRQSRNP